MAGIGKASNKGSTTEKKESLEELERKLKEKKAAIERVTKNKPDNRELSEEEKGILRTEYLAFAQIAKKLSEICTSSEKSEEYAKMFEKASNKAIMYGSTFKNVQAKTTMEDIKGLDDVKKLVYSFLFMAQNPHVLAHYKMEGGLGLLLYGAPGTGKTMFAEAIANAMQLPLMVVTPADIFKSYVGESEQAVKQIFEEMEHEDDAQ